MVSIRHSRLFAATLLIFGLVLYGWCMADDVEQREALQAAVVALRQAERSLEAKNYSAAAEHALAASKQLEGGRLGRDGAAGLQRAAEILYCSGFSQESLPLFQQVVELVPESAPQNWQRGIALCSCGKWQAGAEQFKTHHDVNPDDVENSAWYFLCIAKIEGIDAARKTVIPSRGDGRQPMMSVLKMLKGELEPDLVSAAAIEKTPPGRARKRAQFYADLYIGLYYDCLGDKPQAIRFLKRSLTYGITGYMADTARVYLGDRFSEK